MKEIIFAGVLLVKRETLIFKLKYMIKNISILGAVIVVVSGIFFLSNRSEQNQNDVVTSSDNGEIVSGFNRGNTDQSQGWRDVELVDIRTEKKFRISDFKGEHVLFESFAVWCPTCLKQQNEIKKMRENEIEKVIHIGLDTDPNEDSDKVLGFVKDNEFNWLYAISPISMTRSLIDEFGLGVVNAPQAPIVHICPDGKVEMLKRGVKTSTELNEIVTRGCGK